MKCRSCLVSLSLLCLLTALASAETKEEKFDDGKLKLKYTVDDSGQKEGPYLENHPNGKLKVKAVYKKNELEGTYTEYNEKGKVHITATYKAGKLTGTYTEFTEKGLKKLTAPYKEGELNGTLIQFEDGLPALSAVYKKDELVFPRSEEVMKKKLAAIDPPPDKKPDSEAAERDGALRRLKAYRYICEVPYENVTLDDEMNKQCLAGAKLCEKIGRLDHTPANPGLPEAEYKLGYSGTSKSNLAMGYDDLYRSVDGWMDDSDPSNIDRLGHRRWCINPRQLKTGFGRAGKFSAMFSFDQSQKTVPDFDFVAYPARGLMPMEYFNPNYAWNVSFHPQKYKMDPAAQAKVWEVDQKLSKVGDPLKMNYNKTNSSGFGLASCMIFRPEGKLLAAGKLYLVEIEGIKRPDGKTPAPIRYLVQFFSLKS